MRKELEIKVLCELLSYDPDTGDLFWRNRPRKYFKSDHRFTWWNNRFARKLAGSKGSTGYWIVRIFKKNYKAHRVAYALHYGRWPCADIDHINGNILDNRICNLRDVDCSTNQKNAKLRKDNSSGQVGVFFSKSEGKWVAQIDTNGQRFSLGRYVNINDAIAARKAAEKEYGFHKNHGRQEMLR